MENVSLEELKENVLMETIVREYSGLLRKIAYTYLPFSDDCIEDMVGDVILHICEKIRKQSYKNTGSFKCWICTLATNYLISKYCRSKKNNFLKESSQVDLLLYKVGNSDSLSPIDKECKLVALEKAVHRLPKALGTLIYLRIKEDMTYREMSEYLSQPIPTVALHVQNAYKILKAGMEELGYHDSSL